MQYLLGIDNGGTLIKAVLFDTKGNEIASASGNIPVKRPAALFNQRDMELLWQENARIVKQLVQQSGVDAADIKGVSFSGHGKGLYLWGKDGKPAYDGIMSTDGRANEYVLQWEKDGTADKLFELTCQKILACQPVSLIRWMLENEPGVIENTQWIFGIKDYIRFRFTGQANAEITDFSGSNFVNLKTAAYDDEILQLLDMQLIKEKLPPLKYSTALCGGVSEEAAQQTALVAGTPCAAGMFDIDACAIAMNIVDSDYLAVIAGTWSINEYIAKQPVLDKSVMMNSLYCIPGYYLIEESSATSAANHEWFIDQFMAKEKADCEAAGKSVYALTDDMVESVAPDAANIVFLPFIFGSNYDPQAKATFVGMDSHHTKEELVRAVFEGITFCHKVHLEKLLAHNPKPKAVRLAGGVCNSAVWVQMFADVFALPVEIIGSKELGAFGAALTAGVAGGIYPSIQEAAAQLVRVERTVQPNAKNVAIYKEKYKLYQDVSASLEQLWHRF